MSSNIMNNQLIKSAVVNTTPPVDSKKTGNDERQDLAVVSGTSLPPAIAKTQESTPQASQQASQQASKQEASQQASQEVTKEKAREVVEQLNSHAQSTNRDLQFSVDDDSGRTVIKVINADTAELIRQIPSEEVLKLSETIRDSIESGTGVIVQTSA